MILVRCLCAAVILTGMVSCQYYEDYRIKKGTADIREETADLLRAYRLCLQRYEAEPPKAPRQYDLLPLLSSPACDRQA